MNAEWEHHSTFTDFFSTLPSAPRFTAPVKRQQNQVSNCCLFANSINCTFGLVASVSLERLVLDLELWWHQNQNNPQKILFLYSFLRAFTATGLSRVRINDGWTPRVSLTINLLFNMRTLGPWTTRQMSSLSVLLNPSRTACSGSEQKATALPGKEKERKSQSRKQSLQSPLPFCYF